MPGTDVCCIGDLFLVIYSIDSRESFDEARRIQEQVYQAKAGQVVGAVGHTLNCGSGSSSVHRPLVNVIKTPKQSVPHVPMVIVGNKSDREAERVVGKNELKAAADTYPGSCAGVEASAKKDIDVNEVDWIVYCRYTVYMTMQLGMRLMVRCHSFSRTPPGGVPQRESRYSP